MHTGGSRGPAPLLLRPADAPAARGGEQHAPRQRLPPGCWLLVLVICSCLSVMAIIGSRQRDEGVLAHTGACRAAVAKLRAERRASRILPLCLLQTPCCTRQNSGAAQCTHPLLARRARQQQRGAWCQAAWHHGPRLNRPVKMHTAGPLEPDTDAAWGLAAKPDWQPFEKLAIGAHTPLCSCLQLPRLVPPVGPSPVR